VPTLPRRTATTTRFSAKAARNRRRQGIANIRSGTSTHQMAPVPEDVIIVSLRTTASNSDCSFKPSESLTSGYLPLTSEFCIFPTCTGCPEKKRPNVFETKKCIHKTMHRISSELPDFCYCKNIWSFFPDAVYNFSVTVLTSSYLRLLSKLSCATFTYIS